MPLILEIYDEADERWKENGQLMPGEPPASISNFSLLRGEREIYLVECEPDDQASVIAQSLSGVDETIGHGRLIVSDLMREVRRLTDGESYEMTVMTDKSIGRRRLRFRHVAVEYGTRKCEFCEEDVPANCFGAHINDHPPGELVAKWPGGLVGLLASLRKSVETSIEACRDFPRLQEILRLSLAAIQDLERTTKEGDRRRKSDSN